MNVLNAALYTRLQGSASTYLSGTTAIYYKQAPEDAALPYIVWNIQGGGDENLDANRTKNLVLFIRAYARGAGSAALAGTIDNQIDAALHLNPLTVSGWTNIWLARETDIELVDLEPNGTQIHTAGALYRVRLDKD